MRTVWVLQQVAYICIFFPRLCSNLLEAHSAQGKNQVQVRSKANKDVSSGLIKHQSTSKGHDKYKNHQTQVVKDAHL